MKHIFLILCLLALSSCKKSNPTGPGETKLQITALDASCTEVWIQITGETGKEIQLTRDGKQVQRFTLPTSPYTVVDDSLAVKTYYTYVATRTDNGEKSNIETATTLDTTTNNWNWKLTQLGGASSSALYDVAIVNDTLAYAVGNIFVNDSTGHVDPQPYNVAIWNGKVWRIQKVPYIYQGQPFYHPIQCIYAFGTNDMWLAGNGVQHWDGQQFAEIDLPISLWGQNQVNQIWGVNSSDLYIVGNSGSIAHFNGSSWVKIESGTTLDVVDIYGSTNPSTGKQEILAIASMLGSSYDRRILQVSGTTVSNLSDNPIAYSLTGVWFIPQRQYYVVGSGIYEKRNL